MRERLSHSFVGLMEKRQAKWLHSGAPIQKSVCFFPLEEMILIDSKTIIAHSEVRQVVSTATMAIVTCPL